MPKSMNEKDDKNPFEQICSDNPEAVISALSLLDSYTAAIIISAMPSSLAVKTYEKLDGQKQTEIAPLITRGFTLSNQIISAYADFFEQKLAEQVLAEKDRYGGLGFSVKMMEAMGRRSEKTFIESLTEKMPEVAEEAKKRLFLFEDIVMLDDRSIQKILRDVDSPVFAKALKGVDKEVKEKIFRNMSKEAAKMLEEDIGFIGTIPEKERDEAQIYIVGIIRRLEENGEIVIARSDENYVL